MAIEQSEDAIDKMIRRAMNKLDGPKENQSYDDEYLRGVRDALEWVIDEDAEEPVNDA